MQTNNDSHYLLSFTVRSKYFEAGFSDHFTEWTMQGWKPAHVLGDSLASGQLNLSVQRGSLHVF